MESLSAEIAGLVAGKKNERADEVFRYPQALQRQ
jgi:hypothetical protein